MMQRLELFKTHRVLQINFVHFMLSYQKKEHSKPNYFTSKFVGCVHM